MSNWQWDVFIDAFPIIIKGLWITAGLTVASFILAIIFGFVWTFLRRVPFKPFQFVVVWVMEFIRSTPPLIQLYFIYYGIYPMYNLYCTIVFYLLCYFTPSSCRYDIKFFCQWYDRTRCPF